MAIKQFISLENLTTYDSLIKTYINDADAKSIKAAALNGKKLELYTVENPSASDTPRFSITLPFVEREIQGANGKAIIFNEADGGGAKFEHQDGTWSFVGVNDGGENGITGQIYSVKKVDGKYVGTRINMTNNGFFYTKSNSSTFTADDELVTRKDLSSDAGSKTIYAVETAGGSGDAFSKKYDIYQGNGSSETPVVSELVTSISLPKDMFVESGSVKNVTEEGVPYPDAHIGDYYIDIILANAESEHIYIPANALVDVYTGGVNTEIRIDIDANNEITATLIAVDGSKLVDGTVTKTKLAQSVQNSLDLADTSLQDEDLSPVDSADIEALFA